MKYFPASSYKFPSFVMIDASLTPAPLRTPTPSGVK